VEFTVKKLLLLIIALTCALGLSAQVGLFNLAYGMTLAEADSLLALATFHAEGSDKNIVKYYSDINAFVQAILVFIEPESQRLAGWFVKYYADNGEDNDDLVIQRIIGMHGDKNFMEEGTDQLVWFLSTTRSLHVLYSPDGSLTALYYDSHFPELFDLKKGMNLTPQED
jgi:hypothetical protein